MDVSIHWTICMTLISLTSIRAEETAIVVKANPQPDKNWYTVLGTNTFWELVEESDVFVDKTLFIKAFLEDKDKFYMISLPHHWTKTAVCEMLHDFLQVPHNNGTFIPIEESRSYLLFAHSKLLIEYPPWGDEGTRQNKTKHYQWSERRRRTKISPLLIAKHTDILEKYLCKWPVMYMYFNILPRNTYIDHLYMMKRRIRHNFRVHYFAVEKFIAYTKSIGPANFTDKIHKALEVIKLIRTSQSEIIDPNDLIFGAEHLVEMMYEYYGKKVFVIIDDWDFPWFSIANVKRFNSTDRQYFLEWYVSYVDRVLVNNPYVEKVILSGRYTPWKEEKDGIFKHFTQCSLFTGKFMEYFTFTHEEVVKYDKHGHFPNATIPQIKYWYDGYRVNHRNMLIYNPWSVAAYWENSTLKPLWGELRCVEFVMVFLLQLPKFREKIYFLIKKQNVTIEHRDYHLAWVDIERMRLAWERPDPRTFGDHFTDAALMHYTIDGFFTLSEDYDFSKNFKKLRIKVPNEEMRLVIKQDFKTYLKRRLGYHSYYTFNHTSHADPNITEHLKKEFIEFFYTNDSSSIPLEQAFTEFYLHNGTSYYYNALLNDTTDNQHIFYDLLYFLLIDLEPPECIVNEIWAPSSMSARPDALLICRDRAIMIQMKFEEQSVKQIEKDFRFKISPILPVDSKYLLENIKFNKFIYINIRRNGTAEIHAQFTDNDP